MSKDKLIAIIRDLENTISMAQATIPIFSLVTDEAVQAEANKMQLELEAIDITKLKDLVEQL